MRKLIFTLLAVTLAPTIAFSLDSNVKGFIALDVLNYKKIHRQDGALDIGIGVLDLKVFAEQDNMTAAIKLNIDGNLSVQNNIFEEAYASYRGVKDWKFTLGKGVVKFQNLHWGAVVNSYQDGGSLLDSENGWRKVSNKALVSASYGGRSKGFINTFSLWGDSTEFTTDSLNRPQYTTTKGDGKTAATPNLVTAYATKSVPAFTTGKQLGIANKFELFATDKWTFTTGQIYYKGKLQPKASYAIDFGAVRDSTDYELWVDVLYGFLSKAPFDPYTTFAKNDYFIQVGGQYHIDELWSIVANTEYLFVKDLAHTNKPFVVDGVFYAIDPKLDRAGRTAKTTNYKFEAGVQYQLSKSSFITTGALYERKIVEVNGVKNLTTVAGINNPNTEGLELISSVSFWF